MSDAHQASLGVPHDLDEVDAVGLVDEGVVVDAAGGMQKLDGREVGKGAMWSGINAIVLRMSLFVINLVIARIVAPTEFGIFTVALTVMTIVLSVAEVGVQSAIVREPERTKQMAPTIFTLSLVSGGFLAGTMALSATYLARSLGAVEAASAIRVLALFILVSGISVVPASLLTRDFKQRERFFADASFVVSSVLVMLLLVYLGHPVMGLAWSRVVGQMVEVGVIFALAPERYGPGFDRVEFRRLMAFGLPLAGSNLLTVAISNVDFMIVGRLLHATKLGYYNLAFNISGWPLTIFTAVLVRVTLPTLARVKDSPSELRTHLRAGLAAVSAASFPVCALFVALAAPIIDVVYGNRWHQAWTALVVLALFGAARTVLTLFSDLAIVFGRTKQLLWIQFLWLATLAPTMVFCVDRWGITGAGVAHSVVMICVVLPSYIAMTRRTTPVGLGWIASGALMPLVAAVACGFAAFGASTLVSPDILKLLVGSGAGIVAYVLCSGPWLGELGRDLRVAYWSKG
jgi:PST family polysaccharide transporter